MMRYRSAALTALLLAATALGQAQSRAPEWAERLVQEVRSASFPELAQTDIRLQLFASGSDYFQARFSLSRFLLGLRMRYVIRVNSSATILTAPEEAKRAILAHELAHVSWYAKGNRLRLINLLRFPNKTFRERFEKSADRDAIRRGHAQGLKRYRLWLYQHVPASALAEKRRDYLTPDDIDVFEHQFHP